MSDNYPTVSTPGEGLYKAKGSKFYGYAFAALTEDAALAHVQVVRDQHHKARHHCYAYRLGPGSDRWRANDDGEPSNSAGRPILGQIDSLGLEDVVVVVVRYFGGTKLGVSGLIEAYRSAAAEALQNAHIEQRTRTRRLDVVTDYAHLSDLMNAVKTEEWSIVGQEMQESVQLILEYPASEFEAAYRRLWLILAKAYPGEEQLDRSPDGYQLRQL